ncbi:hypothetical protein CPS_3378 [Colwellia psychrerythraea 34H]|uniref:Uncharacterized protein n=1 Tax=Colwellia psychrerythraea (strain 34H / ATCC BAA-681) TaxID=167879 RepID=Q47YR6_COLP3|nr:hypothetical protein CPS_3378 [Colwellia psychrerythraea 34H]
MWRKDDKCSVNTAAVVASVIEAVIPALSWRESMGLEFSR